MRLAEAEQARIHRIAANARAAKRKRFAKETAERRAEAAAKLAVHRERARNFRAATDFLLKQEQEQRYVCTSATLELFMPDCVGAPWLTALVC